MARTIMKVVGQRGLGRKLKYIIAVGTVSVFLSTSLAFGAFFDTAGQSARPMGMGQVFLATAGDASGFWYNPASLATSQGRKIGLSYGLLYPGLASDVTNYNLDLTMGKFGLGISGLSTDGANEMVVNGGYGRSFGEKLALGANIRLLRWSVEGQKDLYNGGTDDDLSKISFSLDLAATYSLGELFGIGQFSTGVYVKDAIMPNISESGDEDGKLPIEAGLGVMVKKEAMTIEADVAYVDGTTLFRGGAEMGILGSDLMGRAGVTFGSDFKRDMEQLDYDFGIGYNFKSIIFDYAFNLPMNLRKNTDGRHYVSFGLSF